MATLSNEHKAYIVEQLACYESTSDIIDSLNEKFDIQTDHAQISYYNPDAVFGGRRLAKKWRYLFNETRDKFLEGATQIPIAHKQYRLRELQKNYYKLLRRDDIRGANAVLEQAAKEMGEAYTAKGVLESVADNGGSVNFYQQINQKIVQSNKNNEEIGEP